MAERYDVVVAGSGAAGLVAALAAADAGARVLLLEAAAQVGGTTALGGGRVWVPANGTPANRGDSVEAAREYLRDIFDPAYPEMLEAFLETAPEMARFVERRSAHRFVACPNYPDYHQDRPGAALGGRCLDMQPIRLGDLAAEVGLVRIPPGYTPITHAEWEAWRYPQFFDRELLDERMRTGVRTNGVALVAGLLDGVVRAGVRLVTEAAVEEWHQGRIAFRQQGLAHEVEAASLILATGGFDGDGGRRGELPAELRISAAAPSNTGAALRITEAAGARVANLGQGWWMPMVWIPGEEMDGRPYPRGVVRERGTPRQIVVDQHGHRVVDEASSYSDFVKGMLAAGAGAASWIFDEAARARYPFPGVTPAQQLPDWVTSAPTLDELASKVGIDAAGLRATVARWNAFCDEGVDLDFGRGGNAYDRYYGDPWVDGNPCLGPLDEPPFHSIRIHAGMIGTKGGPVTDVGGRVMREDGSACAGLFAVGNASCFWTADGYPGPGSTLGIGMTMGYRAGRAAS